ncbi:hypothetical protein [Streptomyces sp. 142MFCol3.1]|uniref:hypothetical protein n=1 Tax=Streptomyces sp. 142MFCol3.1 TaxID=1172179 RepID=UPI0006870ED8|nr:hypothetical protein [Streptomyces sp. 142MFCol3.1]
MTNGHTTDVGRTRPEPQAGPTKNSAPRTDPAPARTADPAPSGTAPAPTTAARPTDLTPAPTDTAGNATRVATDGGGSPVGAASRAGTDTDGTPKSSTATGGAPRADSPGTRPTPPGTAGNGPAQTSTGGTQRASAAADADGTPEGDTAACGAPEDAAGSARRSGSGGVGAKGGPVRSAPAANGARRTRTESSGPRPREGAPKSGDATDPPGRFRPVRGRHRRPRPRRVLFAVGGLALAAGVLSLARMTPDSVVGGGGSAEAEPRAGNATDPAGSAGSSVTTVEAVPSVRPSAATASGVMGGAATTAASGDGATPTAPPTTPSAVPTTPWPHGSGLASDAPGGTGIPSVPMSTPPPRATTDPATPAPAPGTSSHAPAPRPEPPGVCVPIVGICVHGLSAHGLPGLPG